MKFCLLVAALAGTLLPGSLSAAPPDVVLHSGRIVTVDDSFRVCQAMALLDRRIVAVGDNASITALAGPETQQIDLQGQTVLPGLMDSHVHAVPAATYEFDHRVPEMATIEDVLQYIENRASRLSPGDPIFVSQVFITRLRDQRFPTRQELDRVAPNNPVYFRTGPDASLNSLALQQNGIDRNYKIPDGVPGRIERDPATGEPTGIIRAAANHVKMESSNRTPSFGEQRLRLKQLLADYNAVGITSISDRRVTPGMLEVYESLRGAGELTCRTFLCWSIDPDDSLEIITANLQTASDHARHGYDELLWLRGVKVFLDGGMLTGSALMRTPWGVSQIYAIDDPDYRGVQQIDDQRLYELAKLTMQHGLQFTAHSVGDGAVQLMVDTYRRIDERDFPVREHRPCITHCNFMSRETVDSMAELGVVADLQPAWLWLDGVTLRDHFGSQRLEYFQPYKSLFAAGAIVGGGSDHMQKIGSMRAVNPYNPFLGMWITLSRMPRGSDEPLHPEQRITREQALRLYTINNAYLMFDEQNRGSLEVGKLADFIVIDRDFLTCPLDEVKDIEVESTWLGGEKVFERTHQQVSTP